MKTVKEQRFIIQKKDGKTFVIFENKESGKIPIGLPGEDMETIMRRFERASQYSWRKQTMYRNEEEGAIMCEIQLSKDEAADCIQQLAENLLRNGTMVKMKNKLT